MHAGRPKKVDGAAESSAGQGGGLSGVRELRVAAANALFDRATKFLAAPITCSARVKYSQVSRTFSAAADAYRLCGQWRRCAESLRAAAEAERVQLEFAACAALHADAGDVFARIDAGEACTSLAAAAGLYAALGLTLSAANLTTRQAEFEEADGARANAAKSFALASDFMLAIDMLPQATALLWRAGSNQVYQLEFNMAHQTFERAARLARDHPLVRYNVPKLTLNACLALVTEWAARRVAELESKRKRLFAGTATGGGATRRNRANASLSAANLAAATTEALAAFESYVVKVSHRDAIFSVGREKRFVFDLVDAARAWAAGDFIDHVWNFDFVACLAPHELSMIEVVYKSIEKGPPVDLTREVRAAVDFNDVTEVAEYEEVPVEVLVPMTREELRKSGIMEELEAEAAADVLEDEADRLEEEEIKNVRARSRSGACYSTARAGQGGRSRVAKAVDRQLAHRRSYTYA